MRYILTISFLLISLWVFAQPVALPLNSNPTLRDYAKIHPEKAKPQLKSAPMVLTLPFMDDFSYDGPFPDASLWMDNDIFINNTLGINPPSVGIATLDGLDSRGLPYGDEEGWADTLTSQIIDLSMYNVSSGVILSFFAQPQGFGDAPESIDRLLLEFKNTSGEWQTVESIPGAAAEDFQYSTHQIGSLFLGPEFQFRFRNHNARTGFVDLWHIDYVKIDAGRVEGSQVFEDVCFTEVPNSYLKEFTSMPWKHYSASNPTALGATNFDLLTSMRNHNTTAANNIEIDIVAEELTEALTIFTRSTNASIGAISGGEFDLYPVAEQDVEDWRISDLLGLDVTQAKIINQYYLTAPNQENFYLTNDTVTTETIFANYFAYDDGTAEYNIGLDGEGSEAAVRFTPIVDDLLQAIQIHIPYAADDVSDGQLFNLKVWESTANGLPTEETLFDKEFIPQYGDGIGGFYTYELDEPIPLTGGVSYFIGWEQATLADSPIPIGMDKNNTEASDNNFFNLGIGWFPFPNNLPGALMIRAVVNGDPFFTANETVLNASEIAEIFPNPTDDNLFINLKSNNYENYQIGIFNNVGQLIHLNQLQPSIPVNTFANGVYFIQIKDNNTDTVYYEKFIKK